MGKILFNTDDPNDATRRAFVGEVAFQPLSALASTEERMIWGDPVNVTGAEFAKFKARAESRAAQVGSGTLTAAQIAQISAGVKVPAVDLSAVLAAIRDLPAAVAQYVVNSIKGQWAK